MLFDCAAIILRGTKAKLNFEFHNYIDTDGNLLIDEIIKTKVQVIPIPMPLVLLPVLL